MKHLVVHCKRSDYDVYIGRGRGSRWGNPFSHKDVPGTTRVATRDEAVDRYKSWLWNEISEGRISIVDLAELHCKRLGCWCSPQRCHGEVLASAATWAYGELYGPF